MLEGEPTTAACRLLLSVLDRYPIEEITYTDDLRHDVSLRFLLDLPSVPKLKLVCPHPRSLEPIESLSSRVKELTLGPFAKSFDLGLLSQSRTLTHLHLTGKYKNLKAIGLIKQLMSLSLRSLTLDTLDFLRPLQRLRALWVGLGGCNRLSGIEELLRLQYLELWRVSGLTEFREVGSCNALRALMLQDFTRPIRIPSFEKSTKLEHVLLVNTPGVRNLKPIAAAPRLRELWISGTPSRPHVWLKPGDFDCFIGHQTLGKVGGQEAADLATPRLGIRRSAAPNYLPFSKWRKLRWSD